MQLKARFQEQVDPSAEKLIVQNHQIPTLLSKLSEEAKDLLSLIYNTPAEFEELFFKSNGTVNEGIFLKFFRELLEIRLSKKYVAPNLANLEIINNDRYPGIKLKWLGRKYPSAQKVFERTMEEVKSFCKMCDII